jgi:transposase
MELSEQQYKRIAGRLPVQRGNTKIENRVLLNALIYRYENGCKWRALFYQVVPPKRNLVKPWEYDEELYKQRNEAKRFFRRIKEFGCIQAVRETVAYICRFCLPGLYLYCFVLCEHELCLGYSGFQTAPPEPGKQSGGLAEQNAGLRL